MSATAIRAPAPALAVRDAGVATGSPWLRLVAFGALAGFATSQWATFLSHPPAGRLALAGGVTIAAGAALTALGTTKLPVRVVRVLAALVVVLAAVLAMIAVGLPPRLLLPPNWDELASGVDSGLSGVRAVTWPYGGPDEWVRRVVLLGVPLLLAAAAALSFWPTRTRAAATALRAVGLVLVLLLYAIPVTDHDPGAPVLHGAILFVLLAAWLWLPRLGRRDALPCSLVLLAVGLGSIPAASALDPSHPAIAYGSWNWFGGETVTFDWNHSYGPLSWPRHGTTLLEIKSPRPLYWKAETLDRFDGFRWVRSTENGSTRPGGELPPRIDPRWETRFRVTVRALQSTFVITAGTPYGLSGAPDSLAASEDGTVQALEDPLRRGDTYTARAYVPDPTARQLRAAPVSYDPGFSQYTRIALPAPGQTALDPAEAKADAGHERPEVNVPLRGGFDPAAHAQAAASLERSPYRRAYALSRALTGSAATTYDAVAAVRTHLRDNYTYSERPPSHDYPLEAFLFGDKIGYCQQFSGAMALLLRMAGIPARVVGGFSPGSYDRRTGEYKVSDRDAHSWVEVYFTGIGWVTFDPTPAAAPADRAGQLALPSDPARTANSADRSTAPDAAQPNGGGFKPATADSGPGAWVLIGGGLGGLLVLATGGVALSRTRARRGLDGPQAAEAGLAELERALPRLGLKVDPGTTLLGLEGRLRRVAGPDAGDYIRALRHGRFGAPGGRSPRAASRNALRRGLTAARGPVVWLHGLVLLPPWGPRVRRRGRRYL